MKKQNRSIKPYGTILVRLMIENIHRTWVYRVRRGHKLKPGDELVLDTPFGPRVGYVLQVHRTPQDNDITVKYKFAERRTVSI